MNVGLILQALMGLPMVCATGFALIAALVAPPAPGRALARWGAALMLLGQLGALALALAQSTLIQRSLATGGNLQHNAMLFGVAQMGLTAIAVSGICLLAGGFLRASRAAARARPAR